MTLARAPLAVAPGAALWRPSIALPPAGTVLVGEGAVDAVWAIALQRPAAGLAIKIPVGMVGALPIAARTMPAVAAVVLPPLRFSDRGWIGEPEDPDAPNERWPERMIEPPAIERAIPIYPTAARRSEVNAGEIILANGDGGLDYLASDWRLAGRAVEVLRGPHRSPRRAARREFATVGRFRIARLAQGTGTLRLPLTSAAADLSMAACATYAGTGGPEGTVAMAGADKPLRFGIHRNAEATQVHPGLLAYQLHDGRIHAVLAVRGRGGAYTFAGDYGDWGSLAAANPAAGTYITCVALGLLRLGSPTSSLTVDFRGAAPVGLGYLGTAASIAARLLRDRGGIGADLAQPASFYDWPAGEVRLDATGLTVAAAMDILAGGVGGWWGADNFGRFRGSRLQKPEDGSPSILLEPWMLAGPPTEDRAATPPWYRGRVAYRTLGVVQAGEDLAGAVSAADRAFYGQPYQVAPITVAHVQAAYPGAVDGGLIESAFDDALDASAYVLRLMEIFSVPRRSWKVAIRAQEAWRLWGVIEPGQRVRLTWPGLAALRDGRPLILTGVSARGDRLTLDLWG